MTGQRRLLCIDNDIDFLVPFSNVLRMYGYYVYKAYTLEQAQEILHHYWVHMIIVDINIVWYAIQNRDNLQIVTDPAYLHIPKLILVGLDDAVDNVQNISNNPSLIAGLINKSDDKRFEKIAEAFDQLIHINWGLEIHWQLPQANRFVYLVSLILSAVPPKFVSDRVNEMTDLFRQAFQDATQIEITGIRRRRVGKVWLDVIATDRSGKQFDYVIGCGQKPFVHEDSADADTLMIENQPIDHLQPIITVETSRFAAVLYGD